MAFKRIAAVQSRAVGYISDVFGANNAVTKADEAPADADMIANLLSAKTYDDFAVFAELMQKRNYEEAPKLLGLKKTMACHLFRIGAYDYKKEHGTAEWLYVKNMTGDELTFAIYGGKQVKVPNDCVIALCMGGRKGYQLFSPRGSTALMQTDQDR
jgi:hypothetical protein